MQVLIWLYKVLIVSACGIDESISDTGLGIEVRKGSSFVLSLERGSIIMRFFEYIKHFYFGAGFM